VRFLVEERERGKGEVIPDGLDEGALLDGAVGLLGEVGKGVSSSAHGGSVAGAGHVALILLDDSSSAVIERVATEALVW
jgi:hypothetical protein